MTTTGGIVSALYGIKAEEKRFEILAQNLANLSTPGYKAEVGLFETIMVDLQELLEGTSLADETGTVPVQQYTGHSLDLSSGPMRATGNTLDLAIHGDGFFVIQTPDGPRYTRRGQYNLDSAGQVVTSEGYPIQGQGGNIVVTGEGEITVNPSGEVSVGGVPIGSLRIVDFPDATLLARDSGGLFQWTGDPLSVTDVTDPKVVQGSFELSNVNPVRGMTEMITTMRAYEAAQKVLKGLSNAERQAAREIAQVMG